MRFEKTFDKEGGPLVHSSSIMYCNTSPSTLHQRTTSVSRPSFAAEQQNVRVHCEAADCGALLEVTIPSQQLGASVIVRCGNCSRLLEVKLQSAGPPQPSHVGYQNGYPGLNRYGQQDPNGGYSGHQLYAMSPEVHGPLLRTNSQPLPLDNAQRYGYSPGEPQTPYAPTQPRAPLSSTGSSQPNYPAPGNTPSGPSYGFSGMSSPSLVPSARPSYPMAHQGLGIPPPAGPYQDYTKPGAYNPRPSYGGYGLGGQQVMGPYPGGFPTGSGHTLPVKREPPSKSAAKTRKKASDKGDRPRDPSPYNLFMREEVKRIKLDQPDVDHKVAFKQAANNWAKSPLNATGGGVRRQVKVPKAEDVGSGITGAAEDSPGISTKQGTSAMSPTSGNQDMQDGAQEMSQPSDQTSQPQNSAGGSLSHPPGNGDFLQDDAAKVGVDGVEVMVKRIEHGPLPASLQEAGQLSDIWDMPGPGMIPHKKDSSTVANGEGGRKANGERGDRSGGAQGGMPQEVIVPEGGGPGVNQMDVRNSSGVEGLCHVSSLSSPPLGPDRHSSPTAMTEGNCNGQTSLGGMMTGDVTVNFPGSAMEVLSPKGVAAQMSAGKSLPGMDAVPGLPSANETARKGEDMGLMYSSMQTGSSTSGMVLATSSGLPPATVDLMHTLNSVRDQSPCPPFSRPVISTNSPSPALHMDVITPGSGRQVVSQVSQSVSPQYGIRVRASSAHDPLQSLGHPPSPGVPDYSPVARPSSAGPGQGTAMNLQYQMSDPLPHRVSHSPAGPQTRMSVTQGLMRSLQGLSDRRSPGHGLPPTNGLKVRSLSPTHVGTPAHGGAPLTGHPPSMPVPQSYVLEEHHYPQGHGVSGGLQDSTPQMWLGNSPGAPQMSGALGQLGPGAFLYSNGPQKELRAAQYSHPGHQLRCDLTSAGDYPMAFDAYCHESHALMMSEQDYGPHGSAAQMGYPGGEFAGLIEGAGGPNNVLRGLGGADGWH